ncbi:unnamed protein product [Lactuca saligna]|uniref:Uncharacterized protein n=1 Tax=Lactuca saligna TaxID=75948 RepID=A0AA35ZW30_LACSI|nr:unnamed protein product [Lactuca saligna]
MKLLLGQSGTCMADDLWYFVAQAFALMVAVANWVCRSGIKEALLKTLPYVAASLREELCDSEEKSQIERLENQVTSLTQEKGVLASKSVSFQHQLARALVDGVVSLGSLQWMLEKRGGLSDG